jgi:hypothetical protein
MAEIRKRRGPWQNRAGLFLPYPYPLPDIGGLRSRLERQRLTFIFSYNGDAFDNPVGSVKQGGGYLDKLQAGRGQNFTLASITASVRTTRVVAGPFVAPVPRRERLKKIKPAMRV